MSSKSVKTLATLILILAIFVGVVLMGTVLGAVAGVTVIADGVTISFVLYALSAVLDNQEATREYMRDMRDMMKKQQLGTTSPIRENTPPPVRNIGSTWTCPDCGTVNSNSQRICKDCGHNK